jgi:MATE family multidrug resistance protein
MLFYPVVTSGTGLLLGMDTLVSQSFGAADPRDCRRTLVNGLWLGALIAAPLAAVLWALLPLLRLAGTNPHVLAQLGPYLRALLWSVPALLLYTALRRYLQAVDLVRPVTFALISANLVNLLGNWILMFGHWGAPAMGLEGSGWSTVFSRLYMTAVLAAAIVWHEHRTGNLLFRIAWLPDLARLRHLVSLGLPAAGQVAFEGAVFGLVTVLAAKLDEASLAAHGISINVISVTYMVPLGISSAAAVRVGQARGRKDNHGTAIAGWTALLLSGLFMGAAGLALWTIPGVIMRLFLKDAAVIATGATLLRIAGVFQLFDGFQVVATGALRGLGDTRLPMLAHLAGYWAIGLPVAYLLCLPLGWGAVGIWVGLSSALILIGTALMLVWRHRVSELLRPSRNA